MKFLKINLAIGVLIDQGQFKFRKHTRGSGGVDLYLGKPNGDYLSFLIKLALIKEEGKMQNYVPKYKSKMNWLII